MGKWTRRLRGSASVWHYLLVIALLPSVGVTVLAGLVAAGRVAEAGDARNIDRAMLSIQRLDELHVAVDQEATSLAAGITLRALNLTPEQALQLSGFVVTMTPEEALQATDQALAAAEQDSNLTGPLRTVREALADARGTGDDAYAAHGEAARELSWVFIQDFRNVVRLITSIQSDTTLAVVTGRHGSGSPEVLRAADQLRVVSDLSLLGSIRSADFYLTYVAPTTALPALRKELEDSDAAYRLRAAGLEQRLSPAMFRHWTEFTDGPTVQMLDRFIVANIARGGGRPPLSELYVTGRSIKDYNAGLSALIAAAVAEGRVAATADRTAANERARATLTATAVLLAITIGTLLMLGGRIRRRLGQLAVAAQRLSAGRLEPMAVHGPREIALASAGLNDAVVNLRQVASTAERLAAGDLGSPQLQRATPGPLGAAMHASVELLTGAIRERERLQRELQHQAAHDSLTGLANRAEAERLLTAALERAAADGPRRVGLLFIDLDHFKEVNDTHGHHAGDHVLQVSAARMVAEVRETDTVCRLGGDEFVVILDPAESDQVVSTIGNRIVSAVGRPITYEGHELRVGASVGVAVTTGTGDAAADTEELLSRADRAVYRAKAAGRNGLAFSD